MNQFSDHYIPPRVAKVYVPQSDSFWETYSRPKTTIQKEELDNELLRELERCYFDDLWRNRAESEAWAARGAKPEHHAILVGSQTQSLPADPSFTMGIEFEGMIRDEIYDDFIDALEDLVTDKEGNTLIRFGDDPSIKNVPDDFVPIEFRTEPLSIHRGVRAFENILSFLYLASQTDDFKTNETCGLHINIVERAIFKTDHRFDFYFNILQRFDEDSVLDLFGRRGNKYCLPFFSTFARETSTPHEIKAKYQAIKAREQKLLDVGDTSRASRESKYLAVSLRDSPAHEEYDGPDLKAHRIEFRCIGNADYHLRHLELDETVNHMLSTCYEAHLATVSSVNESRAPSARHAQSPIQSI